MSPSADSPIAVQLQPFLAQIGAAAKQADSDRRPSDDVMRKLAGAGLMRLVVPQIYGGAEVHPHEFLTFTETIAQVHGSAAWTAMTCNEEAGIASAYLEPSSVAGLFSDHPNTIVAGSGVPKGKARRVDGGWSITGRWDFISGCTASDWIVLANVVDDKNEPSMCFVLVPTTEVEIVDTWFTTGLKGTGSNDVVLDDHFVADTWAGHVPMFSLPRPDTAFYRLPSGLRFPFPKVGVAAGIARAALEEFVDLAAGKRPTYSRTSLCNRPSAQAAAAKAEAELSSGRAWAFEMVEELWQVASEDEPITPALHARCRLACSNSVASSIQAVETVAAESGSNAIRSNDPMAKLLADVRTVSAHFMVAPHQMATAGRVLLGLDADDRNF